MLFAEDSQYFYSWRDAEKHENSENHNIFLSYKTIIYFQPIPI